MVGELNKILVPVFSEEELDQISCLAVPLCREASEHSSSGAVGGGGCNKSNLTNSCCRHKFPGAGMGLLIPKQIAKPLSAACNLFPACEHPRELGISL